LLFSYFFPRTYFQYHSTSGRVSSKKEKKGEKKKKREKKEKKKYQCPQPRRIIYFKH